MIKRFHEVIERRNILQAKTFIMGSSKLSLAQSSEYGQRYLTKTPREKVRSDWKEEVEEDSNEVICENFKLIVLRPQFGSNKKGREEGKLWGNFHNYIFGM